MKKYPLLLSVFFFINIFSNAIAGQSNEALITSAEERQELLADCKHYTELGEPRILKAVESAPSPFVANVPAPVEQYNSHEVEQAKNIDEAVLNTVSRSLKPNGTIKQGDKWLLLFDNFSFAIGDSFNAEVRGVTYCVYIDDIRDNEYTLRLNDEKKVLYLMKTYKDQIKKYQGASDSTSANPSDKND